MKRQPRPFLISDARNDAALPGALARMPRGCALIYRHYHLPAGERRTRFAALARLARAHGHAVILAGPVALARAWGADGAYGPPALLAPGPRFPRLVTAHSLAELARAGRARASLILLSPVYPTRSHPGGKVLGPLRFRLLARAARAPVIALGGMNAARARALQWPRFAAIDGLSRPAGRTVPRQAG